MKKKLVLIISAIVICLIIISIILFSGENKKSPIAITVDGVSVRTIPETKNYIVTPTCSNADGSWDYGKWELKLNNVRGNVICTLDFETVPTTGVNTLSNYLINSDDDTLTTDTHGEYRYFSVESNNYIKFNNEIWRIVGVFDSKFHGQSGKWLVKLVRENAIGGYVYNSFTLSDYTATRFEDTSLYYLLNNPYYNSQDVYGAENGCSSVYISKKYYSGSCYFSKNGLNEISRNMITEVNWYNTSESASLNQDYNIEELANAVDICNPVDGSCESLEDTFVDITTGKVGLLNVSDMAFPISVNYASGLAFGDMGMEYTEYTWLKLTSATWLINHESVSSSNLKAYRTTCEKSSDIICNGYAYNSAAVRPVVYLDENVLRVSGDGSYNNPYIITK